MANLKSLAKETAIYGLSSIVGRFLNYLLVPLYTAKLSAASGGYGVITNVYALTALMMVLLTYGMETGFFRLPTRKACSPHGYIAQSSYPSLPPRCSSSCLCWAGWTVWPPSWAMPTTPST